MPLFAATQSHRICARRTRLRHGRPASPGPVASSRTIPGGRFQALLFHNAIIPVTTTGIFGPPDAILGGNQTGVGNAVAFITSMKPFDAPDDCNGQCSAAFSWRRENMHVISVGLEAGVEGVCSQYGIIVIPAVERADRVGLPYPHPLLRSILILGASAAATPYVGIINSDIIVAPRFSANLGEILSANPDAFITGRRLDLQRNTLAIDDDAYLATLAEPSLLQEGGGTDFFVFPLHFLTKVLAIMPEFIFGLPAWDNWMQGAALEFSPRPIMATGFLATYHMPHDYKRINYFQTDCAWAKLHKHPGVRYNRKLYFRGRIRGSVSDPRWHVITGGTPPRD